jgi:chromate transporter
LGLITAVVVGAILDLTLFLGRAVIFPSGNLTFKQLDALSLGWVVLSVVLLQRLKLNLIHLILLSVGVGLIRYLFGV